MILRICTFSNLSSHLSQTHPHTHSHILVSSLLLFLLFFLIHIPFKHHPNSLFVITDTNVLIFTHTSIPFTSEKATKALELVTKLLSDYLSFTKYTIAALTIWGLIYAIHELVKGKSKLCDSKVTWTMYGCGVFLAFFAAFMNLKVDYDESKEEKLYQRMLKQRAHEHHKNLRNSAEERLEGKMESYLKDEEDLGAVQAQKEVTEFEQKLSKEHPAEDLVKCRCGLSFFRFFGSLSLVLLAVHASSYKWFFDRDSEGNIEEEDGCGFRRFIRRDITITLIVTTIISNIISLSWKMLCKESSEGRKQLLHVEADILKLQRQLTWAQEYLSLPMDEKRAKFIAGLLKIIHKDLKVLESTLDVQYDYSYMQDFVCSVLAECCSRLEVVAAATKVMKETKPMKRTKAKKVIEEMKATKAMEAHEDVIKARDNTIVTPEVPYSLHQLMIALHKSAAAADLITAQCFVGRKFEINRDNLQETITAHIRGAHEGKNGNDILGDLVASVLVATFRHRNELLAEEIEQEDIILFENALVRDLAPLNILARNRLEQAIKDAAKEKLVICMNKAAEARGENNFKIATETIDSCRIMLKLLRPHENMTNLITSELDHCHQRLKPPDPLPMQQNWQLYELDESIKHACTLLGVKRALSDTLHMIIGHFWVRDEIRVLRSVNLQRLKEGLEYRLQACDTVWQQLSAQGQTDVQESEA